jgi:hypothetical protein
MRIHTSAILLNICAQIFFSSHLQKFGVISQLILGIMIGMLACGHKDPFHEINPDVEHLICGNEHVFLDKCKVPGICDIFTELVHQTKKFLGNRGYFEYEIR